METEIKNGNVWRFGDDINTDQILPSQYLLLPTIESMKQYAFEPLDKGFSGKAGKGDIIVAGNNFGCGSSREQAPRVLKELGISAVVAKSFARIFFRNAINIGLPVIVCKEPLDDIRQGDMADVDLSEGTISANGKTYAGTKLPQYMQEILNQGGLIEFLNRESE